MTTYSIWTVVGQPVKGHGLFIRSTSKNSKFFEVKAKSITELRKNLIRDLYSPVKVAKAYIEDYDDVGTLYVLPDGRAIWHSDRERDYQRWTPNDYEICRLVDPKTGKIGALFEDLSYGYHKGIDWRLYSKNNKAVRTIADLRRQQKIRTITPGIKATPKKTPTKRTARGRR